MDRAVRIPVRVPGRPASTASARGAGSGEAAAHEVTLDTVTDGALRDQMPELPRSTPAVAPQPEGAGAAHEIDWRDRALRLQAEMENYRRVQQRLAEDRIKAERDRLVLAWLPVVDGLERALATTNGTEQDLVTGIRLILRAALQALKREGVERIEASGQPFDPAWHEAVAQAAHEAPEVAPGTVVSVVQAGYRSGDRLIRPARVVLAP